jgi:D-glycero-alpha-D-manno-heptose-7-phosphate kinase
MHDGEGERADVTVTTTAPVRIVDLGGWTDTWFAGSGLVCCVAAGPATTVQVTQRPSSADGGPRGVRWNTPDLPGTTDHPLLEAVAQRCRADAVDVVVTSAVPPGAGLGTSASVLVALTAALRAAALVGAETNPDATIAAGTAPEILAAEAHVAETSTGAQSGVQDQCAAAHGGVLLIEVNYPSTTVTRVALPPSVENELAERLLTVSFGMPHQSSDLHRQVIGHLEGRDCEHKMAPLRRAAADGAAALADGDFVGYGEAIRANTAAQRALHPALIGSDAQELMSLASRCGAVVKVNGAGGEGGSATVLLPEDDYLRARLVGFVTEHRRWRVLQLRPTATGTTVTVSRFPRQQERR